MGKHTHTHTYTRNSSVSRFCFCFFCFISLHVHFSFYFTSVLTSNQNFLTSPHAVHTRTLTHTQSHPPLLLPPPPPPPSKGAKIQQRLINLVFERMCMPHGLTRHQVPLRDRLPPTTPTPMCVCVCVCMPTTPHTDIEV